MNIGILAFLLWLYFLGCVLTTLWTHMGLIKFKLPNSGRRPAWLAVLASLIWPLFLVRWIFTAELKS